MKWFKIIVFISHFFLSGDFVNEIKPDDVKSVSVMEGDYVTLYTDITEILRDDLILWMFGPQEIRIAQIYMKDIMFTKKEIFGDRLKLDSQTGSLTITNTLIKHTGLYKLQIFRKTDTKYKRFSVTVYAPLSDPVINRKSTSGRSSSSKCVLLCSVLYGRDLSLSWYKGNSLLSSISEPDPNNKLSLTLEVDYQDTNTYSCVVNNPIKHQTQYVNNVYQKCSGLSLSELKHPLVGVIVLLVWLIL